MDSRIRTCIEHQAKAIEVFCEAIRKYHGDPDREVEEVLIALDAERLEALALLTAEPEPCEDALSEWDRGFEASMSTAKPCEDARFAKVARLIVARCLGSLEANPTYIEAVHTLLVQHFSSQVSDKRVEEPAQGTEPSAHNLFCSIAKIMNMRYIVDIAPSYVEAWVTRRFGVAHGFYLEGAMQMEAEELVDLIARVELLERR